jgi:hypothetical protein
VVVEEEDGGGGGGVGRKRRKKKGTRTRSVLIYYLAERLSEHGVRGKGEDNGVKTERKVNVLDLGLGLGARGRIQAK